MKIYNFAFIHPWANGDRYDGEWLDGFRHGKGTLFDNETHKYVEGVWKESKIVEKKVGIWKDNYKKNKVAKCKRLFRGDAYFVPANRIISVSFYSGVAVSVTFSSCF